MTTSDKFTDAATTMKDNKPTELHIPKKKGEGFFDHWEGICGATAPDLIQVKTANRGWCKDCLRQAVLEVSEAR